jgi:phospholipid transport system transporter-binding protein
MPSVEAIVVARDADTLRFAGELVTAGLRSAWARALPMLPGVDEFDIAGVSRIDSAGVAFLAELAQRAGGVAIAGDPPRLSALRAAYRLTPTLAYAG